MLTDTASICVRDAHSSDPDFTTEHNYISEPLKEVGMAVDQDLDCQDDDVAVRFLIAVKLLVPSEYVMT